MRSIVLIVFASTISRFRLLALLFAPIILIDSSRLRVRRRDSFQTSEFDRQLLLQSLKRFEAVDTPPDAGQSA
jgi:hypothetical protein